MAKILVVDDEEKIRTLLEIMLTSAGHQVIQAENGSYALSVLETEPVDLVVSDVCMDEMDGFALLAAIRERELGCPVLFVTAFATLESAVEALRLGAADYLVKPFEENDVILAVERALGLQRLLSENIRLRQEVATKSNRGTGVFISAPMLKVRDLARKVADSDATVLLSGESGTGKEVVANLIHQAGNRSKEPFVALNCAAIAPTLIEAELFGHEKGAFTGADKVRVGKFEFTGNGTLFLDEIGELSLESQAKLLRSIQEKTVQRVGGHKDIAVNCRLICATNRDLAELVRQGRFREDLFYRLTVFPISLPPLRERREDILPLVQHRMAKLGCRYDIGSPVEILTPAAQRRLVEYSWPGNVRELFNVVERAVILKGKAGPFSSDDFPHLALQEYPTEANDEHYILPVNGIDFEELQRSIVLQALEQTHGNQSAAARLLNVSRARFRTLLGLLDGVTNTNKVTIQIQRRP